MIEKITGGVEKTVYCCPLCGSEYEDYGDADDCLTACATNPHSVEEKTVSGDLWVCTDCGAEFYNEADAKKHPFNCTLIVAASHPSQKKLFGGCD